MTPKGSSASKGTKKKVEAKRAAKAASQQGDGSQEPTSGPPAKGNKARGKKNKKEPRVKQYIAPPKPPRGALDPIDVHGLSSSLDPQLVVTLRKFMKKDDKTVGRALDEFSAWLAAPESDSLTILMCLPVWLHHFAKLSLHPDKRIRQSTALAQLQLLQSSEEVREALVTEDASFLANWIMLAFDADRAVRHAGMKSWNSATESTHATRVDVIEQGATMVQHLLAFVEGHQDDSPEAAGPAAGTVVHRPDLQATPSAQDVSQSEDALSRETRTLVGSLDAITWIIRNTASSPETIDTLLHCSAWSMLRSHSEALPPARKSVWNLLSAMFQQGIDFPEDQISLISQALFAAFEESDAGVQCVMWNGLLVLLERHPQAWAVATAQTEDQDSSDDEGVDRSQKQHLSSKEDPSAVPAVIEALLGFISQRCSIQPAQNYPGLILLVASIPTSFFSFINGRNATLLFDAFWGGAEATQPMLDSALECMLFVVKRTTVPTEASSRAAYQISQAWRVVLERAAMGEKLQTSAFVAAFEKLRSYQQGMACAFTLVIARVS